MLDAIQLEVKAGQVVALVGSSGAGKTTLANLVPRFYDVTGGAIRIDGHDIRDLRLASLRDKISIVAQDTFLFNDTVTANIGYGLRHATREQIQAGGSQCNGGGIHRAAAAGLRHHHRRARREALGRPAPAARDRAGTA